MIPNDIDRELATDETQDTQPTSASRNANEAKGSRPAGNPASAMLPGSGSQTWSKDEIAELARNFEGDTETQKARVQGDPVLRRILASLGRRSKPPSGPPAERSCSDGGDYVVYAASARPASGRREPPPASTVVVAGTELETVLLPGRGRRWVRRTLAILRPLALVLLGAASGVAGSRWAARPSPASIGSAVTQPPVGAAMQAPSIHAASRAAYSGPAPEQPHLSPSAAVEPHARPVVSNPPSRSPTASGPHPPSAMRAGEAAMRKPGAPADPDGVMEAVGY